MEQAFQNYERVTREAWTNLLAVLEAEREILAFERRDLEEARRALELDRATMAAEIAPEEVMVVRPSDRVLLDVGGKRFETTRNILTTAQTLAPGSVLGQHEGRLQADGYIFINRNGEMFQYILDFLRAYSMGDGHAAFAIHELPETQLAAMLHELDYYGLESAVFPTVPFSIDLAIFSPGPEMLLKRHGFGAVVLPESRGVLVVGGYNGRMSLASTELLDLDTQIFSPGPLLESSRGYLDAVLEVGQVVVVGGYTCNEDISPTTEVLNPGSNTWSPGPNLVSGRCGYAAVSLSNARILIIGGKNNMTFLSTTEIIDLASGTSEPGPEMSCPRFSSSAVMLHDGRVLVIGGRNSTTESLSSTEILDITDNFFSPGPEMDIGRRGASVTLLPEDGRVLVIGGEPVDRQCLATTEVLDVIRYTTSAGPELATPRSFHKAVKLPGEGILVIGGYNGGTTLCTSEVLGMPNEERRSLT